MRRPASTRRRRRLHCTDGRFTAVVAAATFAAATLCAAPSVAIAGSTDPVLVIGQATSGAGSPPRIVDLLGSWGFDDALQIDYPLSVVVSQGSSFVRYPFGQVPVAGTFAGLADGLSVAEVSALEAAGAPAADASITRLALHEMTLALPPVFSADSSAGSLKVVLYVSLPGEGTFLSNTAAAHGDGL